MKNLAISSGFVTTLGSGYNTVMETLHSNAYKSQMVNQIKRIRRLPKTDVQFYKNFTIISGECFNGITEERYYQIINGKKE